MPADLENKSIPNTAQSTPDDEVIYLRKPCLDHAWRWRSVIQNELYSRSPVTKPRRELMQDIIQHFCEYYPEEAGEILNKKIWQAWNSDVSDLLIDCGADLNVKNRKLKYPTLFCAIRSAIPAEMISKLINRPTNPANYAAYAESRNGVTYTIMLVTALIGDKEKLAVLAKKFPEEIEATKKTLDEMQHRMELQSSESIFSAEFNDYDAYEQNQKKVFFSMKDISNAYKILVQIENENNFKASLDSLSSYSLFPKKQKLLQDVTHEDKRIICRNVQ